MPRLKRGTVGVRTPRRQREFNKRTMHHANTHIEHTGANLDSDQHLPSALAYDHNNFKNHCAVGTLNVQCPHCSAKRFPTETAGMCCSNGKVNLDPLPQPPPYLLALFNRQSSEAEHFLANIRKYNCVFQLTSFGCNEINLGGWNPNFRIQGQTCHRIGSLEPAVNDTNQYLQIYFMDGDAAASRRMRITDGLQHDIILTLQEMLHSHNKYVREIKSAYEFAKRNFPVYRIVINEEARPVGGHKRRFNAPSLDEVAILMPNDPVGHRDIVLHTRSNNLQRISEMHKAYDPLQYPLLHPFGSDGWSLQLKLASRHKITQLQYYCFQFFTRPGNFLLLARRLLQQFMVDSYAKIETERLQFLRREQGRLRADNYNQLRDTVLHHDGNPQNVGQKVILPATYCGGPRYMFERQQDAIAYVRQFGRPDLFITVTTNPKWPEIVDNLQPGQQPHDRPDLLVRVFRLKLKIMFELLKNGCFGDLDAWLYSIEFQKRGLPHAHILLWLSKDAKIHPDSIDKVVSAELPDKDTDPELASLVLAHMIHGPCGLDFPASPCMKNGKCSKQYPRDFLANTELGTDSYPKYKRRSPNNDGVSAVKMVCKTEVHIDNRWVVPYNPWLLRQMQCHINVEICASVKSIKYVLKYVHKGSDQATFQLQQRDKCDEISKYLQARYIGSTEAAWRIFNMPIQDHFPTVVQLAVHLENGQRVYFNEDTAIEKAQSAPPSTTLTSFFLLCAVDDFAASLLYSEVPKYYTWDTSSKLWKRRKRGSPTDTPGVFAASALGRIYTVSPKQGECFYMRLLLLHVKGPTSFAYLRSVEGHEYATFREACLARGLLENDNVHRMTMQEAQVCHLPKSLRDLFAVLLHQAFPSDPISLWEEFKPALSEDFVHRLHVTEEQSFNMALIDIENTVMAMGGSGLESFGLPTPLRSEAERIGEDYRREVNYNIKQQEELSRQSINNLTDDQRTIFNLFMIEVNNNSGVIFFLDAPGGCGKTYLIETILCTVRSQGNIAIASASSGLAATMLTGGRTVHSTFKVPLNVMQKDSPLCSIKKGTSLARMIQEAAILVIDEAPMLHRKVLEALDGSLRDLRSCDEPMGGLTTMLCGDFRQILPVVPQGTRSNVVDACLKRSQLWQFVKTYKLHTNLRVLMNGGDRDRQFSDRLLDLGNGTVPTLDDADMVSLSGFGTSVDNIEQLLEKVFPNLQHQFTNSQWISERAILSPFNETVLQINKMLTDKLPGSLHSYLSVDTIVDEDEAVRYPIEFLNSIEISGLPNHVLSIKIGMPVIILRSLKPPQLINGTRCIVTKCLKNVIEVEIAVGPYKEEKHFIPRIPLQPSDTKLPFQFQRRQFPIRPSFAITVNKSQGQTLKCVGLDLRKPVFTHGMLYVALSRTGSKDAVYLLTPDEHCRSRNVIYSEVL